MSRLPFLVGLFLAAGVRAAPVPPLVVEAPRELAGAAEHIRSLPPERLADAARLAGLADPGPPIRVVLVPEGSPLALRVPPWIAGFADPAAGVVVLLPARAPSFPDASLDDLLRHEVAHVLIGRASGGRPLPRWFQEGLAMIAGNSWGLEERSRFTLALVGGTPMSFDDLDRAFAGDQGTVQRAYAVAGAFVRDLVQRRGRAATARILAGVAAGLTFEAAFQRATGSALAAAAESFWERQTFWYRWVPLLTSSVALWLLVTLLALWAMRKRRARDAAQRRRWEEEDRPSPPEGWIN